LKESSPQEEKYKNFKELQNYKEKLYDVSKRRQINFENRENEIRSSESSESKKDEKSEKDDSKDLDEYKLRKR